MEIIKELILKQDYIGIFLIFFLISFSFMFKNFINNFNYILINYLNEFKEEIKEIKEEVREIKKEIRDKVRL